MSYPNKNELRYKQRVEQLVQESMRSLEVLEFITGRSAYRLLGIMQHSIDEGWESILINPSLNGQRNIETARKAARAIVEDSKDVQ